MLKHSMEARNVKDLKRYPKSAKSFPAQSTVSSAIGLNGQRVTRNVVLVCKNVIATRQSKKNTVVSFALVPPLKIRSAWSKSAQWIAKFPIGGKTQHVTNSVVVVRVVRSARSKSQLLMVVMVAPLT
jgi:hypothetical protein